MTIQELLDHCTENSIPLDTEIYLHHFTTGFEPALLKEFDDYFPGESILDGWPENAVILSNDTI